MEPAPAATLTNQASTDSPLKAPNEGALPSFNSITKKIVEENALNGALALPLLEAYELQRKQFEEQGFSHNTTCLVKAFCYSLEQRCPSLREVSLTKSISLFATLLMFHEYEMVVWFCFTTKDTLDDIIREASFKDKAVDQAQVKKLTFNHLINTAFFTKRQTSTDAQFEQYQAFFDNNFQIFQGKHTDWLLLNEPDTSLLTPMFLNQKFNELVAVFDQNLKTDVGLNLSRSKIVDFNEITTNLLFESELQTEQQQQRQEERHKAKICQKEKKERRKRLKKEQSKLKAKSDQKHEANLTTHEVETTAVQPPAAANDLQKQVSTMIIQQLQTPAAKMPTQPFIDSTPLRLRSNLNDSLMWQTMQSNIYDMNTIMRALNDENQVKPLDSSNYVPTMAQFPDNPQGYQITGNQSQLRLHSLLQNNRFGGSSILQMPGLQTGLQTNGALYQNSQLFQQPSQLNFLHNLAAHQNNNGLTATGATIPHPKMPANLQQSNSMLNASALFKNPQNVSNMQQSQAGLNQINTNITSFLRSYSQLGLSNSNVAQQAQAILAQQQRDPQDTPKPVMSLLGGFGQMVPQVQGIQGTVHTNLYQNELIKSPKVAFTPTERKPSSPNADIPSVPIPTLSSMRRQQKSGGSGSSLQASN